jgi:hypothetical protein
MPPAARCDVGIGAAPPKDAEVIIDGTRKMLDEKWTYWKGPGFKSSLPIKWKIVDDPVDKGTVVQSDDPVALGGKFGTADIVTDTPGGLKLQCEGHDVRFRNGWIKEMVVEKADTDFTEKE